MELHGRCDGRIRLGGEDLFVEEVAYPLATCRLFVGMFDGMFDGIFDGMFYWNVRWDDRWNVRLSA